MVDGETINERMESAMAVLMEYGDCVVILMSQASGDFTATYSRQAGNQMTASALVRAEHKKNKKLEEIINSCEYEDVEDELEAAGFEDDDDDDDGESWKDVADKADEDDESEDDG